MGEKPSQFSIILTTYIIQFMLAVSLINGDNVFDGVMAEITLDHSSFQMTIRLECKEQSY